VPTKSQHAIIYRPVMRFLRSMREKAGLTQRQLAKRIKKPLTWVHESETGSRRVDIAEFVAWAKVCGRSPIGALRSFLKK
jgi:transcriptional regulator with XRE-family HTH domain